MNILVDLRDIKCCQKDFGENKRYTFKVSPHVQGAAVKRPVFNVQCFKHSSSIDNNTFRCANKHFSTFFFKTQFIPNVIFHDAFKLSSPPPFQKSAFKI